MKHQHLFFIVFLFSALLLSCGVHDMKIAEPTNDEIAPIKPIGDKISKELITTLQKELKAAVQKGGLNEAINVCNMKAVPLTEIIADATDRVVHIKRTSYKFRNTDNAPDNAEKAALDYYQTLIKEQKEIPPFYIQKIEKGKKTYYNYYKPMGVKSICLNCHGSAEKINPKTLKEIYKLYPDDKALNYKDGDFRGLIRISIE